MCMQCVRADRREAEGHPARWQVRPRFLMLPGPGPLHPTAAELARAIDATHLLRDARFTQDRTNRAYPGRTVKTDTSPKTRTLVLRPALAYRGRGA